MWIDHDLYCGIIWSFLLIPDSQLSGFVTATPQHDFAESSARLQGWLLPRAIWPDAQDARKS